VDIYRYTVLMSTYLLLLYACVFIFPYPPPV